MTVNNEDPTTAGIAGPSTGVPGQPLSFTLTADDPSATDDAAGFTFTMNWGDGVQVVPASPSNGAGTQVTPT